MVHNKNGVSQWLRLCFISIFAFGLSGVAFAGTTKQTIDLPWVLGQTLLNNPNLKTFPYEQRVIEAQQLQAGIRPNPRVSMSLENVLGTGAMSALSSAETNLALSQLIEMGDKRQRRIEVAEFELRQLNSEFELTRLDVLSEAANRYYQLLRLQALAEWNQRRIEIERNALATIEKRANAGAIARADVSKMALRVVRSEAVGLRLEGELRVAQRRLAAMWGSEGDFSQVEGQLSEFPELPEAADVLNAIETAPSFVRLLDLERLSHTKVRLAQANANSDITVGMGIRRNEALDDIGLTFNFSIPLALTNPNEGNILAAKAEQDKVLEQQRLARSELRLSLLEIHQGMSNNLSQGQRLSQQILPIAKQLLKDTESAYRIGQANVLQLVDAQNELFAIERELIEAKAATYLQLLELERITGQSMTKTELSSVQETL